MARRVNSQFLIILSVLVVGLGLLGFVAKKFLIRESPEKYVSAGTLAMAEKKYDDAVKSFARAVSLDPKNPSLWVAYGDALNQLSPTDTEYMIRARKAWASALTVQPEYKPALDRMMQFLSDAANIDTRNPEIFKPLHETAIKLFAADPSRAEAEIAIQTSVIRPWLAGIEQDEKLITDTVDNLLKLMQRYPDNADLPMFAAQAKLHLAERRHHQDRDDEAKKLYDESEQIMRAGLKASPSAAMYFSAAQVVSMQKQVLPQITAPKNNAEIAKLKDDYEKLKQREREMYAQAREKAKSKADDKEDPLYVYIHIQSARALVDQPSESEKILRDLIAKRPEDQQVRLALAEQLSNSSEPAKRGEALKILDRPFANEGLKGPKAYMVRELQITTLVMATNLRMELMRTSADDKAREQLKEKIQDGLNLIAARDGEGARVLRLRGKLMRIQGKTVEAIQTLERARGLAERQGTGLDFVSDRYDRWEVIDMLAKAYIETKQIGRAKALLTDLVYRFPAYDPARMLLAQVLVQEGDYPEAQKHIHYLAEKKPGDPDIAKLQLQASDPRGTGAKSDRKAVKEIFARLAEQTKQQILDKIGAAMYIEQPDEAVRLLNKGAQQFPGDYDLARAAVSVYHSSGDTDAARAFVDAALKAKPTDTQLLTLRRQVADLTPEGLARVAIENADKRIADADTKPTDADKKEERYVGYLIKSNAYRRLNQPDKVLSNLMEAKKIKPDEKDVDSLLFSYYTWQKQWDRAEGLIEGLARANQDQAGGLLFRYKLAIARNDYKGALDYGNALVQRMGEFALSWISLAQAQQAIGYDPSTKTNYYEEALKNYLAALERQSDSVDAFKGAIDCYYALNRPVEAGRRIADARRALPANQLFQELEVQHEMSYGDPEKAIPAREAQVRKDPERAGNVMLLGQAYLAAARTRAAKPGSAAQAADYFKKAKQQFKTGVTKWPDAIEFYAYYAETGIRSGEVADSEQMLKQLAARDAWKGKPEPQTLLAEFYGVTRRPEEAETALLAVLAQMPANLDAEMKLATLLVNQKRVDDALKVLEVNAGDPRIGRRRVEVLLNSGRSDEAEKEINKILEKTPSNKEMLQMASGIYIARQNFDMAERRLTRALEIDRKDPTTHYYLGLLRMSQPKPDMETAIKELELGRDSPQAGMESRFARADCLRRMNDPDAAIRELEDGLKQQPGSKRMRLALLDAYAAVQPPRWIDHDRVIREASELPGAEPDPDLLHRDAVALAARDQYKPAVDKINKALELAPNDMNLTRLSLGLLNKARKYPDVIAKVDALVAKDPTLWWAYLERARAKRSQDHKDEAVKDFEAALTAATTVKSDDAGQEVIRVMGDVIGPTEALNRVISRAAKDDRWKLMQARLQQMNGDTAGAVKSMEEVLAREDGLPPTDRAAAWRFGGMLYLVVNQPLKSKQCYDKLLDMTPDDMTALNNMACLLGESMQPPQPQEGLKFSQRAFELMKKGNRRDPQVLDTHGWLLTLAGRVDEGIDTLRKANELRAFPDGHYHLAMAYLQKQFPDEAQRELDMAMDLINRAKQDHSPLDQTLQPKVENAIARAGIMMRQKRTSGTSANANAPAGTNVP